MVVWYRSQAGDMHCFVPDPKQAIQKKGIYWQYKLCMDTCACLTFVSSAQPLARASLKRNLPVEQRYGSKNGMTVTGSQVTSPVSMWLHALEALLQRLKVRLVYTYCMGTLHNLSVVEHTTPVAIGTRDTFSAQNSGSPSRYQLFSRSIRAGAILQNHSSNTSGSTVKAKNLVPNRHIT